MSTDEAKALRHELAAILGILRTLCAATTESDVKALGHGLKNKVEGLLKHIDAGNGESKS